MKRYTTEDQILKAIESEKVRAHDLLKQSEHQKAEGKRMAKLAASLSGEARGDMIADADWAFKESSRLLTSSENIMDKKLKKLVAKLAQFRTETCAFVDGRPGIGDKSVSVKLNDL